ERFMAAFKRGDFRQKANFNPDQPRDELGRWTDAGGGSGPTDEQGVEQQSLGLTTAAGQGQRSDLSQLEAIAHNPSSRPRIDEAWVASNPDSVRPQEHGFWISRNEATGEVFARPFASRGFADSIQPGPTPDDAIAFFHTHPNRPDAGYSAGPSFADRVF